MKKILLAFLFLLFSSVVASASTGAKEVCSGFAKWMDDGTFKQIRESKCMSEAEYQAYINSPDYMCKYLAKSIWKDEYNPLIHDKLIYTSISRLRKLIEPKENSETKRKYIIRGKDGYTFNPDVKIRFQMETKLSPGKAVANVDISSPV